MRAAEELRYLVLALQRAGNLLLAAELRPLDLTPAQAEVITVLVGHQPLSLTGLGELLVCETGTSPSRIVDRLVKSGLVAREVHPDDRRHVQLSLTSQGTELATKVADVDERLHNAIDDLIGGRDTDSTLTLLRAMTADLPAGRAVARRRGPHS